MTEILQLLDAQDSVFLTFQTLASITTILGVHYGTTERKGSAWYLIAMVPWWAAILYGQLWGLLPLQLVMTVVCVRNLRRSWA